MCVCVCVITDGSLCGVMVVTLKNDLHMVICF